MSTLTRTITCKLAPSPEAAGALRETMVRFAEACNAIAAVAWQQRTANKYTLQRLCYTDIRNRFGLSANLAIRAIARVAAADKRDKNQRPTFRPTSIDDDARIFRMVGLAAVSLTTTAGRVQIPLVLGDYQRRWLTGDETAATLSFRNGVFFLPIVVKTKGQTPTGHEPVGVDLGLKNIATTSNGLRFSGRTARHIRRGYWKRRQSLQAKGTKGARRVLKRLRGRESRWMRDLNHVISRRIVDRLKPGQMLVFEDLKHIRSRLKANKRTRRELHTWAFGQLFAFCRYKASERGIAVVQVDPRNTSRRCPRCGCVEKANRNGHLFSCISCGYRQHADVTAAFNIAAAYRAAAMGCPSCSPEVSDPAPAGAPGTSSRLPVGSS